jgi:hypothetical protein
LVRASFQRRQRFRLRVTGFVYGVVEEPDKHTVLVVGKVESLPGEMGLPADAWKAAASNIERSTF